MRECPVGLASALVLLWSHGALLVMLSFYWLCVDAGVLFIWILDVGVVWWLGSVCVWYVYLGGSVLILSHSRSSVQGSKSFFFSFFVVRLGVVGVNGWGYW